MQSPPHRGVSASFMKRRQKMKRLRENDIMVINCEENMYIMSCRKLMKM